MEIFSTDINTDTYRAYLVIVFTLLYYNALFCHFDFSDNSERK